MKTFFIMAALLVSTAAGAQSVPKLKMADVVRRMNQPNDTTYIINFWATFCKPCVAEIPGFLKVAEKYKAQKVKLILVSLDLPEAYPGHIAGFVAKNKWKTSIAWLNENNADIFCPMIDSTWTGGIPATVIVNAKRGYKKFWEGETSEAAFEKELMEALNFEKKSAFAPKFISPMSDVVALKYYDIKNHPLDQVPFEYVSFKSKDSTVFAVKEGEVVTTVKMDGMRVVIIKNGDLLYTYSNLKTVQVKKGALVTPGQVIGFAANDLDNLMPAIDFYVSDEKGNIPLTKNNFLPRYSKEFEYQQSPLLRSEPE
jgi:thiol-disulfide isomerase/thioredoxin